MTPIADQDHPLMDSWRQILKDAEDAPSLRTRLAEAESILNTVTLQLTPELCERIRAFLNSKEDTHA